MRQIDRPHVFGIDARPDDMRVPPPVFLVEDNGARLAFEAELALDLVGSILEIEGCDGFAVRRVEAGREQVVFAARAFGDGIDFAEGRQQIIADEAANLVQLDMIVVPHRKQVTSELRAAAAFFRLEDHGFKSHPALEPDPVSCRPSAISRSRRIACTSLQACRRSPSVSGVTGSEPVFTALASWFRLLDRRD